MSAARQACRRLIGHDARIAAAALRHALGSWSDRLTIVLGLPIILLVGSAWARGLDGQLEQWLALALGIMAGLTAGRTAAERLHYHRSDGVLAELALVHANAICFALMYFAVGLAMTMLVGMVVAPGALATLLAGNGGGCLAGFALQILGQRRSAGAWRSRRILEWMRRPAVVAPIISVSVAAIAVGSQWFEHRDAVAVAGVAVAAAALLLGPVDSERMRFSAQCGQSTWLALRDVGWRLVVLGLVVTTAALALIGQDAAVISAGITLAALLIQAMAVMIFRTFPRRMAELVFAVSLGVLATAWLTMLPIAPPVQIVALAWLARKSETARWRLA